MQQRGLIEVKSKDALTCSGREKKRALSFDVRGAHLFLVEAEGAHVVLRVQRHQARRLRPGHLRRHPHRDPVAAPAAEH